MALGETPSGNPRRGATRKREFFADRKLRQALEEKFLGHPTNFRRRRRQQADLHKIKQKKPAKQSEGDAMGRSRMAREAQAHDFIFLPGWMRGDGAQKRSGKIETFEQNADVTFGEGWIGKRSDENFLSGVVEKCAEFV